jgi:hypothetical protein
MARITPTNPLQNRQPVATTGAAPDTYVQSPGAQRQGPGALTRLADALQHMEPELQKFTQNQKVKADERDLHEARALYEKTGATFNEMVRAGKLPAGASPVFQRHYRLTELRNGTVQFDNDLRTAWSEQDADTKSSGLDEFERSFRASWTEENLKGHLPAEIGEAFSPGRAAAVANLQRENTAQNIALTKKLAEQATAQQFADIASLAAEGGNLDEVATRFTAATAAAVLVDGTSGPMMNKLAVDSIVAQALANDDPDILKVLDKISTGKGVLGRTTYATKQREQTEDRIATEIERKERHEWARAEHFRTTAIRTATEEFFQASQDAQAMGQNLSASAWYLQSRFKGVPGVIASVTSMDKATFIAPGEQSDGVAGDRLRAQIRDAPFTMTHADISEQLLLKTITIGESATLGKELTAHRKNLTAHEGLFKHRGVESAVVAIRRAIEGSDEAEWARKHEFVPLSLNLQEEMRESIHDFITEGIAAQETGSPALTRSAVTAKIREIRNEIFADREGLIKAAVEAHKADRATAKSATDNVNGQ